MTEKSKKRLLMTSVVTLLPMLIGIVLWNRLPERIATHFDSYGEPNGWSSRAFAVFGIPLFICVINAVCAVTTERDPRRSGYPSKMMRLVYWIPAAASWAVAFGVYSYSLGLKLENTGTYVTVILGILLIVIGNYMPKVKQNYFLGIKLPWTYADEDNWNRTHRFAGRVWVIGGILLIANWFIGIKNAGIWMVFLIVVLPMIYSWVYFLKKNKGGNEE